MNLQWINDLTNNLSSIYHQFTINLSSGSGSRRNGFFWTSFDQCTARRAFWSISAIGMWTTCDSNRVPHMQYKRNLKTKISQIDVTQSNSLRDFDTMLFWIDLRFFIIFEFHLTRCDITSLSIDSLTFSFWIAMYTVKIDERFRHCDIFGDNPTIWQIHINLYAHYFLKFLI